MYVEVIDMLESVDYRGNKITKALKPKLVAFLNERITEFKFMSLDSEGDVDLIEEDEGYGFGFAVAKADDGFRQDLGGNTFEYKDEHVQNVLCEAIKEFDMKPVIKWDRGHGVFVFNIFVEED